jgi:hypothetical protein
MVRRAGLALAATLLLFGCKQTQTPMDANIDVNPGGTIPCNTSSDCPPNLPMCHPMAKICIACLPDFQTCGDFQYCDPTTFTCMPSSPDMQCVRTSDCPRPGWDPASAIACEKDAGQCVGCVTNNDCVAPKVCIIKRLMCDYPCSPCACGQFCVIGSDGVSVTCNDPPDAGSGVGTPVPCDGGTGG